MYGTKADTQFAHARSGVKSFCSGRCHVRWFQGIQMWVVSYLLYVRTIGSCGFVAEPSIYLSTPSGRYNRHTLLQTRWLISLLDNGNIQVQSVSAAHLVAHGTNHS